MAHSSSESDHENIDNKKKQRKYSKGEKTKRRSPDGYKEKQASSSSKERQMNKRANDYNEKRHKVSRKQIHKRSPDSDDVQQHHTDDKKEEVLRERLKEKYLKHRHDKDDVEEVTHKYDSKKRDRHCDIDPSDENSPNTKRKKGRHRKEEHDSRDSHNTDDRNRMYERESNAHKHYRTDESRRYKSEQKDQLPGRNFDRSKHDKNFNRQDQRSKEREWDKGKPGKPWDRGNSSSAKEGSNAESQTTSTDTNIQKEEPNFKLSGKLTEYTNTYNGVVIVYNEPPEARKPKTKWRLYPFKGQEALPMLPLHRQSAFLLGRDRKVADVPIDHPSCSKQHAVFQFRIVDYERPDGSTGRRVKPYVIDLESRNGTFVNNKKIDSRCYVELLEKDVVKFGFSSREYVLLHEKSQDDAESSGDDGEIKQTTEKIIVQSG